ncbi:hypothetical protein [Desnuesiella massiliensis]|uniref:hypothetical protein n=1 Tax=Desnuesiella massiliensis TaxID=1650662 RepID=UPI0006E437E0|nr:hypothetical protein [Desnuesiella massiliensis]
MEIINKILEAITEFILHTAKVIKQYTMKILKNLDLIFKSKKTIDSSYDNKIKELIEQNNLLETELKKISKENLECEHEKNAVLKENLALEHNINLLQELILESKNQ